MKFLILSFLLFFTINRGFTQKTVLDPLIAYNENNTKPYVDFWTERLDSLELLYQDFSPQDTNYLNFMLQLIMPRRKYVMDAFYTNDSTVLIKTLTYIEDNEHPEVCQVGQLNAIFNVYVKKNTKGEYSLHFENSLPLKARQFKQYTTKYLTYITNENYKIDKHTCKEANRYLDKLYEELKIKPTQQTLYIISTDKKTTFKYYGFDYSVNSFVSMFNNNVNTLFDIHTKGFYKHELVHKAMYDAGINQEKCAFITEGLAVAISNETAYDRNYITELQSMKIDTINQEHIRKIIEEEQPYFFLLDNPTSYKLSGLFFKQIINKKGLLWVVNTVKKHQNESVRSIFQALLQSNENPYPIMLKAINEQYHLMVK